MNTDGFAIISHIREKKKKAPFFAFVWLVHARNFWVSISNTDFNLVHGCECYTSRRTQLWFPAAQWWSGFAAVAGWCSRHPSDMPGESPVTLPDRYNVVGLLTVHCTGTRRYFLCDWAAHRTAARFVVAGVFANSSGPDGFSLNLSSLEIHYVPAYYHWYILMNGSCHAHGNKSIN